MVILAAINLTDPRNAEPHECLMTKRRGGVILVSLIVTVLGLTGSAAMFITPADYFGNRRTDYALVRGFFSTGPLLWFIADPASASVKSVYWGVRPSDTPVTGDFDGDGIADVAVYRSGNPGVTAGFYIIASSTGIGYFEPFGGGLLVPGDYDGDGRTDVAVYDSSSGIWWYKSSLTGAVVGTFWGLPADLPAPADYDGDGKTDFAVRRDAGGGNAQYFIKTAAGATSSAYFGFMSDYPVPADYDGDGKADLAVVRLTGGSLYWFVKQSSDGQTVAVNWGLSGDQVAPGDYDGDGVADFGVFRFSGTFFVKTALTGNILYRTWGIPYDFPVTTLSIH
jgi:FG-GAP-like repeat